MPSLDDIDDLIAMRLYWQLPIIAQRAREAAENVRRDAIPDPDYMRQPMTI